MTDRYLYSGAAGAANGTSWTDAWTDLLTALAGCSAGDNLWVADDHAESKATSQIYAAPTTSTNPVRVFCARRTGGSTPPVNADLRTTATISTTGSSSQTFTGYAYCYGITFNCGNSTGNANFTTANSVTSGLVFDNCALRLGGSNASNRIFVGVLSGSNSSVLKTLIKSTSMQFASTSQAIAIRGDLEWIGGSITGATLPTTLFSGDGSPSLVQIRDIDFSSLGSGKTIFGAFVSAQRAVAERCKLGASVTVAATQTNPGVIIDTINCDSGSTNYVNSRYMTQGVQTTETTVVMSSGASDGTTAFSHKIITTASASPFQPFESVVLAQDWVNSTGSAVSQTFELVTDNVTLTDQDAWIDYEYLGDGSFPLGTAATTFGGFFATGSNLTSSSVTWTTSGLGTPVKQKIVITFTPQQKGVYRAVLKVAKASTTLYVNPPAAAAA